MPDPHQSVSFQTPSKGASRLSQVEAEATPFCVRSTPQQQKRRPRCATGTPSKSSATPHSSARKKHFSSRIPPTPQQQFPKTVYLIRHGESLGQAASRNGMDRRKDTRLLDAGLTQKGINQALIIPQLLGGETIFQSIELILSSPLTRALHTAALAFQERSCPLLVHNELREVGSRVPENTTRDIKHVLRDLKDIPRIQEVDFRTLQPSSSVDDYASPSSRQKRIKHALEWLAQERTEQTIAIVCHFHVIRGMLAKDGDVAPQNGVPIHCHLFSDGTLRRVGR